MLEDARAVADGAVLECDLAIVGAGAAGIALALELADGPLRVCLLEAGGLELDGGTQELYQGENVGLPYFDLTLSRLRFFGGTTNHWAGYCVPFDAHSLEQQAWIADSGWPLGWQELAPYYPRADRLLGLAGHRWDVPYWEQRRGEERLPVDDRRLASDVFLINPVRMGQIFGGPLRSSAQVTVYLNANVTALEADGGGHTVSALQVRTLAGKGFRVAPQTVVLAAGAIENARLLLASAGAAAPGLGNRHDLVGRYFADHPYFPAGVIQPASPGVDVGFHQRRAIDGLSVKGRLKLAEAVLREEQLVPVAIALLAVPHEASDSAGARSLKALLRSARQGELPSRLGGHIGNVLADLGGLAGLAASTAWHGQLPIGEIVCEVGIAPAPNPDSRVYLGDKVDTLGMRQVVLDWRLSEIDRRSARRALEILAQECGRIGLGRMQIQLDGDDRGWPDNLEGSYHHMGTTRMADDPRKGVVDRNCRVRGTSNLYVAGSSVFPTYGLGSPTQLLIALALRLADHLKQLR